MTRTGFPTIPGVLRPPTSMPVTRRTGKALVLTGGGALGAFQVGAIKKLWESGYRPDLICGISVGALNAVKLAEGDEATITAAQKLENLWTQLANGSLQIMREWAGVNAVKSRVQASLTAKGTEITAATFLPPLVSAGAVAGLLNGLPDFTVKSIITEASRLHALNSVGGELQTGLGNFNNGFRGLIDLIQQQIRPDLIAQNGIKLRVGMVDMESGSLWMATEPRQVIVREPDGLVMHEWRSLLEREPDLFRSITDPETNRYIDLGWATYASSVMPVYFPPVEAREYPVAPADGGGKLIECSISGKFRSLLRGDNPSRFGEEPAWKHFFDGGLADIVPIRTAMRLGYREITVIGTSPLHQIDWSWMEPDGINAEKTPLLQYLNGFINCWGSNVARSDIMLSLAYNEFLGWIYRLNTSLPAAQARAVREQFETYWRERRPYWENVVGATSWLGGKIPSDPTNLNFEFGRPFFDEGCQVRVIAPETSLAVGALGFTERENLNSAMNAGYSRMTAVINDNFRSVNLSFPVPDSQLMTQAQAIERGLPIR